ncbi:MAG TPA: hypothetical protein VFY18_13320 [Candidatus Limnocylindrales bacterium]|nr:hypothetical protein [Candidatus Limnocylindrales bacterium]
MADPDPMTEATTGDRIATRMIFWSSLSLAAIGLLYAGVLGTVTALGALTLPPPEPVGSFAAIDTIASAVLLVVLVVAIDTISPPDRRAFSRLSVVFTAMFAVAVTINRFVQLTIVRQSVAAGDVSDLRRFLPYDPRSAMFALEILGWGFFFGLAALCLVPILRGPGLRVWIARLMGLYGLLGLICALGLVLDSPVVAVGFLAWGGVLPLAAGLIAVVARPGARHTAVVF